VLEEVKKLSMEGLPNAVTVREEVTMESPLLTCRMKVVVPSKVAK
jgi:hypothetical protein